jgi:hypothetical protein
MKTSSGVLKLFYVYGRMGGRTQNLKAFNISITDGMDFLSMPLSGIRWYDMHAKFYKD